MRDDRLVTLGTYLASLRKAKQLSKSEFARRVHVAWSTANNWEAHGAVPDRDSLKSIIEVLELAPDEKTKLLSLAMAGSPPPDAEAPHTERKQNAAAQSLDAMLTKALDPSRHSFSDAGAVFKVLLEAAPIMGSLGVSESTARVWLDAASWLRTSHVQVSAATLAIAVAQLALPSTLASGSFPAVKEKEDPDAQRALHRKRAI